MKAILLLSAAAVTLAACNANDSSAGAQSDSAHRARAEQVMQDTANFTTIEWLDSTNQDLGKVMMGAKVEVVWRFRNSGNKPLVIERAQPGCGCTVAEKPEAPIAPGGEGRIRATFDSEGRAGSNHKNVLVMANTKPRQDHDLQFSIEVGNQ
ncbi:DUF1573 domain-containing protein [Flaviaesturariibacter flavus]|uniref:DUF1573 domain-containing protein n=1 Tax=Flaviaesturariibacter flavus TaxID=2502780 RepID=A0A4R1BA25_9BACT|nr:DUF1573 domain-containing protein [Flaviaesturariibacter flavus]TCJ13801.1 DUF1573 domain-containing protein [Flaviaesturariibacter flavus]